jgi:hypothetical protein
MAREGSHLQLFAWLQERLAALQHPELAESLDLLRTSLEHLATRIQALTVLDSEAAQLPLRGLVERLAQVTIATLLLEQAATALQGTSSYGPRQLLVAQLFMRRHLQPHPDGWQADDDRRPLEAFETLLQGAVRLPQPA